MKSMWSPHTHVGPTEKQSMLQMFWAYNDVLLFWIHPQSLNALGRLTEQHEGQEEEISIHWKPTKCQVHQLHFNSPQWTISYSPLIPSTWNIVEPQYMFDEWMNESMNGYRRAKLKTWNLTVENEFVNQWRYRDLCCVSFGKLTRNSGSLLIIPPMNISIRKLRKTKRTPCLLNRQLRNIGSDLTCLLDL